MDEMMIHEFPLVLGLLGIAVILDARAKRGGIIDHLVRVDIPPIPRNLPKLIKIEEWETPVQIGMADYELRFQPEELVRLFQEEVLCDRWGLCE